MPDYHLLSYKKYKKIHNNRPKVLCREAILKCFINGEVFLTACIFSEVINWGSKISSS